MVDLVEVEPLVCLGDLLRHTVKARERPAVQFGELSTASVVVRKVAEQKSRSISYLAVRFGKAGDYLF